LKARAESAKSISTPGDELYALAHTFGAFHEILPTLV